MTDRDALLAAILAHPDEDTPRLAFADWLEENGQGDRAAFIRAQIEEARAEPFGPQAREAQKLWNQLLVMNWDEWMIPPGDGVRAFWFRRGFVNEVALNPCDLIQTADTLLSQHPIDTLRLGQDRTAEYRDPFAPVFELPCLTQIRRLEFAKWTEFLDEDYVGLAHCPHLNALKELAVPNSPLDPPWLSSVLEGNAFPELTGLDLAENPHLRDSLTKSLPRADHRQLRRLNVSGITFSSEQLQRVLASRCLKHLEALSLGWTGRAGEPGPLMYLTIGWVIPWTRLMVLDLAGQRLGDDVANQIANRPEVAALRWLGLAHNELTHDAVRMLVGSRHLNLYHLDVRGNRLVASDLAALKGRFPDAVIVG